MILSLDMSLRSSGYCVYDEVNQKLLYFGIIKTDIEDFMFEEDRIIYIEDNVLSLIDYYNVDKFVIEGLSFNSKSSSKDLIAGSHWAVRSIIKRSFPKVLIGVVPVTSWRNKLISIKEQKEFKKICKPKDLPLKQVVFRLLPDEIQKKFLLYVEENNLKIESVFDLTDAYWIAIHRSQIHE